MNLTEKQIEYVRSMDLLTYLKNYEPHELVKLSDTMYATKTHENLRIINGKWYWLAKKIRGRSALEYLVNVRNMWLIEAIDLITQGTAKTPLKAFEMSIK